MQLFHLVILKKLYKLSKLEHVTILQKEVLQYQNKNLNHNQKSLAKNYNKKNRNIDLYKQI